MGFFTKDIKTQNDYFVQTLQDIYYAGQQIAKKLAEHGACECECRLAENAAGNLQKSNAYRRL
ncbi:hypothetical protein JQ633_01195 [Bradyrhizobium tropiciagri]|uniref:hypothetical protein n=1 Tax=Bradyrhizobium tropiciagri TaxID=312253 RepID=UPI001BA5A594|nr:hypothetical protein [Bradyrhizobium tropiciagri]MBR0868957.1 hypothetical protein [Bradyrhizobium tropiciagri]